MDICGHFDFGIYQATTVAPLPGDLGDFGHPRQRGLPHSCGRSSLKQRMNMRRPGPQDPPSHGKPWMVGGWEDLQKPTSDTLTARQGRLKFADFKKTIGKARMLPFEGVWLVWLPFNLSASNVATEKSACLVKGHER